MSSAEPAQGTSTRNESHVTTLPIYLYTKMVIKPVSCQLTALVRFINQVRFAMNVIAHAIRAKGQPR